MKKDKLKKKLDIQTKIAQVKNEISKINNGDGHKLSDLLDKLDSLEADLNTIVDQETAGLIVRSRIRWAEHGERSSKYFCNLEKRSNEKKNIHILKNESGSIISDQHDIIKELQSFYQSLYTSKSTPNNKNNVTSFLNELDLPHICEDSKAKLNCDFTRAEILTSLKSLNLNRSPGYDGLPAEFYVVFFNDICDMLIDCYQYSFDQGFMSMTQCNGVITLLPKKDKDPHFIKNYRPITLLNTDYKIIAKVMANRLKSILHEIIHNDQTGFMKGRNIGCNIRSVIDLIDYCDTNDIPGSIVLLDIEKAFDSVEHDYLFEVLKAFNLGSNFVQWIKTFYCNRRSYISNNGFLSNRICMERGIFQGCPISPLLFLCAIEVLAISIRNNENICGIKVGGVEKKISLLADDTTCFLQSDLDSFKNLFEILNSFASLSGCKINMSKSEAIHIGSSKDSDFKPFSNEGLVWKENTFRTLGVNFSLNVKALYELNFIPKLTHIEQILACWRSRNLSLIGKITVIKTLLLPQLLYLFSILCIPIPKAFFRKLNTVFFKFIWNGGNDRVKRNFLLNDYSDCGLRMIDVEAFSQAQKMVWVKHLLDPNYNHFWKHLESEVLHTFHNDNFVLWKTSAPNCVLALLKNTQLAESLRIWYLYRDTVKDNLGYGNYHLQDLVWWNGNIRLKTKKFFFYEEWFEHGICTLNDLYLGNNFIKSFEDLVLEFDISIKDRRKYNFLMNGLLLDWFYNPKNVQESIFEKIVLSLFDNGKISKYSYIILKKKVSPLDTELFWFDTLDMVGDPEDIDWSQTHENNFSCSIETQLRSFYFKIFHKAICTNRFLHRIGRNDSPFCQFCEKIDETLIHLFCECDVIVPLWDNLSDFIKSRTGEDLQFSNFHKMFGFDIEDSEHKDAINFLILCLKFYIHRCKFQKVNPSFQAYKNLVKVKVNTEYKIAENRGKISKHFKKFSFDLNL